MRTLITLLSVSVLIPMYSAGQNSFSLVYQLLQSKCSGAGCHNGSTATFNVNQTESAVYSSLVNITPLNPAAGEKGNKLVSPGDPARSFLLRKISHGISSGLNLTQPDEGNYMPYNANALEDNEIELFRQWILFGAPLTGNVVDTALINTYYRDGGIDDTYGAHNPPPANLGTQIYLGKLFIPPATEKEYFIKYDMKFDANTEIPRIVTMMPQSSHHFVIYKFVPGTSQNYAAGIRDVAQSSHSDTRNPIATGTGLWDYDLPAGTAFFWEAGTVIDLNLHIKNADPDSILAADLYANIYTQPQGTAQDYMNIRLFPNLDISIPQDGQEHTYTEIALDSAETNMWKVWTIYTHTHKYGTDYDTYIRNADGTFGTQVYEGKYSYEQGFMVGYYRTGPEVTFRFFADQNLLEVDPRTGFIHEAKFKNTSGPDPVNWGLTSDDEMMVLGIQYILGDPLTDVPKQPANDYKMAVYPNPSKGLLNINYTLKKLENVTVDLVDMLGKKVSNLFNGQQTAGTFNKQLDISSVSPGIYFLTSTFSGKVVTQKLVIAE